MLTQPNNLQHAYMGKVLPLGLHESFFCFAHCTCPERERINKAKVDDRDSEKAPEWDDDMMTWNSKQISVRL